MLDAIEMTAIETQERVARILNAMDKTKAVIKEKAPKIYSKDLVDVIFLTLIVRFIFWKRQMLLSVKLLPLIYKPWKK